MQQCAQGWVTGPVLASGLVGSVIPTTTGCARNAGRLSTEKGWRYTMCSMGRVRKERHAASTRTTCALGALDGLGFGWGTWRSQRVVWHA